MALTQINCCTRVHASDDGDAAAVQVAMLICDRFSGQSKSQSQRKNLILNK